MHLGDIYYSGTEQEVDERFLKVWPDDAATMNRALNGNHEMYSGGFGYFKLVLPKFGQDGSYFAVQNDDWLLVGLDTAYIDHDMDNAQVGWLNAAREAGAGPQGRAVLTSAAVLEARLAGPETATGPQPSPDGGPYQGVVLGPRARLHRL